MSRPAIARINLDHLRHNYRLLNRAAGTAETMAVVKANAYGHEQYLVAPALFEEGCRNFGVTDASEGSELRAMIGEPERAEITLLSGLFDKEDAELCMDHTLTPVITEPHQLQWLSNADYKGKVWLKFDTGMNRLGAADPEAIFAMTNDAQFEIRGFMSHLACADEPDHPLNAIQTNNFNAICEQLAPEVPRSLLNSAGLISLPDQRFDVIRPGIALYGAEPIPEKPLKLKPVMTMTGEVMQVRQIASGASLSYGATFTAETSMQIAVVGMGYADGIPRALSNRGRVSISGKLYPVVGRICMDYTMIDVSGSDVKRGDVAEFWGEAIQANDVANMIDTISYTLFTGIGERVRRKAV